MTSIKERQTKLEKIANQIQHCTRCKLHKERTHAVPGAGPVDAEVLFLGEGPGAKEDEQGLPFVGASGTFLDELLESIGLDRETVFITNVVKCRPPGNRDPHVGEVRTCTEHYLNRQLEVIQPPLIVTLGRFALNYFFPDERISEVHGQPRQIEDTVYLPLYHPAAALYRGSLRSVVKEDFQHISEFVGDQGGYHQ